MAEIVLGGGTSHSPLLTFDAEMWAQRAGDDLRNEALTLSDRLVVMNGGQIEQIGNPLDIYQKPATTFVASFIGAPPMNL